MNSSNYLTSARTFSIGMFLLLVVAYGIVAHHVKRPAAAAQLETELANLLGQAAFETWQFEWGGFPDVSSSCWASPPDRDAQGRILRGRLKGTVRGFHGVEGFVQAKWGEVVPDEPDEPVGYEFRIGYMDDSAQIRGKWTYDPRGWNSPEKGIEALAQKFDAEIDPLNIRRTVENLQVRLERTEIAVPGLGLDLPSETAIWAIAIFAFGAITIIRNRLRRMYLDPTRAMEEPWIVLDCKNGSERLVAAVWLLGILASPWLLGMVMLASTTAQIRYDRSVTTIYEEILVVAVILVLTLWGAAQSLHIVGMVLDHRIARRDLIERQSAGSLGERGN